MIVVGENISFVNLILTIAAELGVDELEKKTSRSVTLLKVICLHYVFGMIWG